MDNFIYVLMILLALGGIERAIKSNNKSGSANKKPSGDDIGDENKKCPSCAEIIKIEAVKCRYCGHKFDPIVVKAEILRINNKMKKRLNEMEELEKQTNIQRKSEDSVKCTNCNNYFNSSEIQIDSITSNCPICGGTLCNYTV